MLRSNHAVALVVRPKPLSPTPGSAVPELDKSLKQGKEVIEVLLPGPPLVLFWCRGGITETRRGQKSCPSQPRAGLHLQLGGVVDSN